MPYDALEDEFGDVVGKARRGQERSVAEVAAATGLSAADVERIEAYQWIPEADGVDALAAALGLHPGKLRRSAAASYFPEAPQGAGGGGVELRMLVLGTDFLMNGYVVICTETRRAAIVDPGFQAERLLAAAAEADAEVDSVWLTHGHGDHVAAVPEVVAATGATAAICTADLPLAGDVAGRITGRLVPGEQVQVGQQAFSVRATPGHTPGGVSLVHEGPAPGTGLAFVGDALFAGSLGGTRRRRDYDGQRQAVAAQLLSLPPAALLCPGHGPASTVAEERAHNPFFDL